MLGLRPRIGQLVEAKPNGGYGAHHSRLEEYGLEAGLERERFARYMAHFGIQPRTREAIVAGGKVLAQSLPATFGQAGRVSGAISAEPAGQPSRSRYAIRSWSRSIRACCGNR